jgi:uncharacterized protein (DUF342 family)
MTEFEREINKNASHESGYDVIVNISGDYYQAFITLHVFETDIVVTKESLLKALTAKNVVFGIKADALNYVIENPRQIENLLIAQGSPHINGKDSEITYLFDIAMDVKPTINVDGTVDFKNMNFLQTVYKGDILASKTNPTPATPGTTVTGKVIQGKPGKIKNFKVGKGTVLSEDGLAVLSDVTGSIQFEQEKISVIEVLEIRDDIGVKTGNIEFQGKVIINGNVTTGYSIESEDEIVINGIVEGATIKTKGNLFINGGVQGHDQADLIIGGNIISKFINNAKVFCGGDIESDAIMHSEIICDGGIKVKGKKALIVGGDIAVRYDIEAKVIGSEMGTMTKLRLGVDSKVMDLYQNQLEELKELKETITKLSQASRLLSKQYDQSRSPEIKAMLDKTETSRTDYTRQLSEASLRLKELTDLIETLKGSKVKVEEIYPGVKLRIGNVFYNVKSTMNKVVIKRDEGEIRAITY